MLASPDRIDITKAKHLPTLFLQNWTKLNPLLIFLWKLYCKSLKKSKSTKLRNTDVIRKHFCLWLSWKRWVRDAIYIGLCMIIWGRASDWKSRTVKGEDWRCHCHNRVFGPLGIPNPSKRLPSGRGRSADTPRPAAVGALIFFYRQNPNTDSSDWWPRWWVGRAFLPRLSFERELRMIVSRLSTSWVPKC